MRGRTFKLFFMKSALLFFLVFLPALAVAQASSGAELRNSGTDYVRICGPTAQGQPNQYAGVCNVWLTGVVDGMQAYNANMKVLPLFDASNITVGQVSKLVVNYVTAHPQQARMPTAALVLGALVDAYPRKEPATPPPTKPKP
jgi:Rap1a immunity proteins